jgi:sugar (pentulose or hexulose) kinase
MTEVALGIDFGTSGVRVAAVSHDLQLMSLAQASINEPLQNFGRHMQDPRQWLVSLAEAFTSLKLEGMRPVAIAVDGTSGTILPVSATGEPLGMASMYNDLAEPDHVRLVTSISPEETAARGGTSPLARAIPILRDFPDARLLHQADWITGLFLGRFDLTDENNALKTGYDPIRREWPSWIGKTGVKIAGLPGVKPAGTALGRIAKATVARFNLPEDVEIIAGTTDGCAAFLASGAAKPGDGVTSLGSTLTLKLLSETPVFAPAYGIYSHRIGDEWLAGGASNSGGTVLAKYFSKEDIVRLSAAIDPNVPTGLDYYPLPGPGERFPINDPKLEPRLSPRPTDDRLFFQGLLEGMAAIEALAYRRLAELRATPLASMRSVGGGAANEAWTRIRLKALGVPFLKTLNDQAAFGTARLAWRGLGHAD